MTQQQACTLCGAGGHTAPGIIINGHQLRNALEFLAPDNSPEQLSDDLVIELHAKDNDFPVAGLYAYHNECPEEGAIFLDEAASGATELWAVHAQGPDELYAAFSREDAEKHAAELNALPMPEGISVGAVVIPSPWPAAEHWKYLAEQDEHKDTLEGQRRNLAATLLSQNHELMEARAALAQPSPSYAGFPKPTVLKGCNVRYAANAQPSPAPELERPEVMAVLVLGGVFDGRELGDNDIVTVNPAIERLQAALVTDGEVLVELMTVSQHDRLTQSLRYKAELYDEVWELVTGKGHMNVTTAISKLEAERDAAQARVTELEKQEPVVWLAYYFGGKRNGTVYGGPCATKEEMDRYILQVHRSDDSITLEGRPLYAAPVAQAGQDVRYVPINTKGYTRHPNDRSQSLPACEAALDARGDSRDQGLDPFWKWGFREGFQVAQTGQVPEGWRVVHCTSSSRREGEKWEVYDPQGSGGVVSVHDVKDWAVRGLLDALAAAPAQGMPTEAELEAAGLGYPLSKEEAVALWNDRSVVAPGGE